MSSATDEPTLDVKDDGVTGEVAIVVTPGMKADKRDRALDALLAAPLHAAAEQLQLVLAASPSAFAFPIPGKGEDGRMRFTIRARVEGDRLVPYRGEPLALKVPPQRRSKSRR